MPPGPDSVRRRKNISLPTPLKKITIYKKTSPLENVSTTLKKSTAMKKPQTPPPPLKILSLYLKKVLNPAEKV